MAVNSPLYSILLANMLRYNSVKDKETGLRVRREYGGYRRREINFQKKKMSGCLKNALNERV
jgi:hypothetical protein